MNDAEFQEQKRDLTAFAICHLAVQLRTAFFSLTVSRLQWHFVNCEANQVQSL